MGTAARRGRLSWVGLNTGDRGGVATTSHDPTPLQRCIVLHFGHQKSRCNDLARPDPVATLSIKSLIDTAICVATTSHDPTPLQPHANKC